ncbi:MAG: hypothetical protein GX287_02990 [Fusobacteria bacterium]|nr:hypothetical protein [Fusobacteriota bacterium]
MIKLFMSMLLTFIVIGCSEVTTEPNPIPKKIIIKNMLNYEISYEISGFFMIDDNKYTDETRTGTINLKEEIEIGSIADGPIGGLNLDKMSIFKSGSELIYESDVENIKFVDLTLKEEYKDEELKKMANMFISNEGFGLLVDEKLITEFK